MHSYIQPPWPSGTIIAIVTIALAAIIQVGTVLRSTVRQLDATETQVATLNDELLHRSRNALQIIQALASGAKASQDPAAFYRSLEGRLKAMADANLLLQYGAAHGCTLHEVISVALKPFDCDRITFDVAVGQIESGSVVPLALALHELATNATKYGALSNDSGRVSITCSTECQNGLTETAIFWTEIGGPTVSPPLRRKRLAAPFCKRF
ncbi:sensor histidine kinase [Novosphingobium aquae]|uniref:histidine kinase n=1 Tax=Novosphingobium aquae TaxID=3133435 RepID=A0ABU8SB43_9SPHN